MQARWTSGSPVDFWRTDDGRVVAALTQRLVQAIGGLCRAAAAIAGGKVKSAHQALYPHFRGSF